MVRLLLISLALGLAGWLAQGGAVPDCDCDLNDDQRIDAVDVALARAAFNASLAGDVDGNGKTDSRDIALVRAHVFGVPEGSPELDQEEIIFLMLVNDYRAHPERWKNTLDCDPLPCVSAPPPNLPPSPPVYPQDCLNQAAQWMATDTGTYHYFGHDDRLGRDFGERVNSYCGWTARHWGGETAHLGGGPFANAQAALTSLTNSPGHNGILIDPKYRSIGIGRDSWHDYDGDPEWASTRSWYIDWSSGP